MRVLLSLLALFATLCAFSNAADLRHFVAQRNTVPSGWRELDDLPAPNEKTSFRILLKQRNLDELERRFWEVSDPDSVKYGEFLTKEGVTALVVDRVALKAVMSWLFKEGVINAATVDGDSIKIDTTVANAERLLSTEYRRFQHHTGVIRTVAREVVSVPAHLREHIDFIAGASELFVTTRLRPVRGELSSPQNLVTPHVLRSYYDIDASYTGSASNNNQGIAAFSDYYSSGALKKFEQEMNEPSANVIASGVDCIASGCDQYESDLDVQYMTSMGKGIDTYFLGHNEGAWILEWAEQLANLDDSRRPKVNSISYGWSELGQCDITTTCDTLGYTSEQYVHRTNTALQKLGTLGVSVFVSSGDDGAASLGGASGNCPIDDTYYCPASGCRYTNSSCQTMTIIGPSGDKCFFPMGIGSDACQTVLKGVDNALEQFLYGNEGCSANLDQDRDKLPHFYSQCPCGQLSWGQFGGYTFQEYKYEQSNGPLFMPDYPTGSPYVTSVGATMFDWSGDKVVDEVVCTTPGGAKITSGGGFSTFMPMPDYQANAVRAYVSSGASGMPPAYSFNTSNRAYPDITLVGHNYQIYASTTNGDQCPCESLPVDGTSCSSPAVAGMFTLINDKLLKSGSTQLGFLNPLLYKMAANDPSAFNDITRGNINCNRAYCCKYGFPATSGWDAASGLGSPNWERVLEYATQAKHAAAARRTVQ